MAFNRVMRVPAAFVEEHRACGELDGGADDEWSWMTCRCGVVISGTLGARNPVGRGGCVRLACPRPIQCQSQGEAKAAWPDPPEPETDTEGRYNRRRPSTLPEWRQRSVRNGPHSSLRRKLRTLYQIDQLISAAVNGIPVRKLITK